MSAIPIPADESQRLHALRKAAILDTPPEREFDELVELAAAICRTPISAVTLIDSDRQWFKARIGLAEAETTRDLSFCAHTILGTEPLIVPDATLDDRFSTMPNVTGDPSIRFYAGVPMRDRDGYALGSLCVVDCRARMIDPAQARALSILAHQASVLIETRKVGVELRTALTDIKELSSLLPMCAWCKRVRNDDQYWEQVDRFLTRQLDARITHSICPQCVARLEAEEALGDS